MSGCGQRGEGESWAPSFEAFPVVEEDQTGGVRSTLDGSQGLRAVRKRLEAVPGDATAVRA